MLLQTQRTVPLPGLPSCLVVIWRAIVSSEHIALAGAASVLDLLISWNWKHHTDLGGKAVLVVSVLVGFVLLLLRRRFPMTVMIAMLVHSLMVLALTMSYLPTLGLLLALHCVAYRESRNVGLTGLGLAFVHTAVGVTDAVAEQPPQTQIDAFLLTTVMLLLADLAAFGTGRWAAWNVGQRQEAAYRAKQDATAAERARIARELHDIVAHAITLMVLQAAGAAKMLPTRPDRTLVALKAVDELGQQAVVELQRMLGLLQAGAEANATDPRPIRLAEADRFIVQFSTPEQPVSLIIEGTEASLAAGVELSASRIVQEALTNAARYADPQEPIVLRICWSSENVEITVTNLCHARRDNRLSTGHGLIGMRERATACGGEFHAGPRPNGQFVVTAILPLVGASADV